MARETTDLAHNSLTCETNHQRRAVIAFGWSSEIFDTEVMSITADTVEFIVEYRLFIAVQREWRSTTRKFLKNQI